MQAEYLKHINSCVLLKIYEMLGKKWTLVILHSLLIEDEQTFNSIRRKLENIVNPTLLSSRLKSLERYRFIEKTKDKKYKITNFGRRAIETIYLFREDVIANGLYVQKRCITGNCLCTKFFVDK